MTSDVVHLVAPAARLPWDIHPALTEDRLRTCGLLLANARRDAVRLASPELGDDPWSVGCRAYASGRQRLRRAVEGRRYNWLTLLDETLAFTFAIEGIPIRFFRGLADEPSRRTLRRQALEAEQLALTLGEETAEGLVFRFALEAAPDGRAERVVFLALRGEEGRVECLWPVPLDPPGAADVEPRQPRLLGDDATETRLAPRAASRAARRG